MKNFLNLFRNLRVPLLFALLTALLCVSCEEESSEPDCNSKYCTVIIWNGTGENLYVGVGLKNFMEPPKATLLYNNTEAKFNKMPAGYLWLWASFDNVNWTYEEEYVKACDVVRFNWEMSGKKSTLEVFYLLE